MKKLITTSVLALVMLSLALISCEKEKADPAPVETTISTTVTWLPRGADEPTESNKDNIKGPTDVHYMINPKITNPPCEDGTWDFKVIEAPAGALYVLGRDSSSGAAIFTPATKGTYKIMLTYNCPDGKEISITVTFIVS